MHSTIRLHTCSVNRLESVNTLPSERTARQSHDMLAMYVTKGLTNKLTPRAFFTCGTPSTQNSPAQQLPMLTALRGAGVLASIVRGVLVGRTLGCKKVL